MSDNYNDLRQEYNRPSFRDILKDNLGNTCCNCGSDENIEYHHIVPLRLGGTNKISNIVPLCRACHEAAHYGGDILKYRKNRDPGGRPGRFELTDVNERMLWDWAKGRIGTKEFKTVLDMTHYTKLKQLPMYKEFIQKHGIKNIRNTFDVIVANGNMTNGRVTSVIEYNNGNIEPCKYYAPVEERF